MVPDLAPGDPHPLRQHLLGDSPTAGVRDDPDHPLPRPVRERVGGDLLEVVQSEPCVQVIRGVLPVLRLDNGVADEEQERRFQNRIKDPTRRWKLSPMDLQSRKRWVEYSKAKDAMFAHTDIKQAPWYVVNADVKKHARLNCIKHLLSMIPYQDLTPPAIELLPRQQAQGYVRPPLADQTFVPEVH